MNASTATISAEIGDRDFIAILLLAVVSDTRYLDGQPQELYNRGMTDPPENVSEPRVKRHFDSLAQEAFLSLWRTYDRLRILEDDLFQRFDITAQQYNVLRLLRGEFPERLPTLALASRLVSRAPDITRMLDKLTERELIERVRLPQNRRVVEVGITEVGLKLLKELDSAVRKCHQRQLGHLTESQLYQLIDLLHQARLPHEDQSGVWH